MTAYAIGVDPDTTKTAIALVSVGEKPQVVATYIVKQSGKRDRAATMAIIEQFYTFMQTCIASGAMLPSQEEIVGIAVEGQEIYQGKGKDGKAKTGNPKSVLALAPISGAIIALFRAMFPKVPIFFPAPKTWKGNRPKHVHHNHIGRVLGWEMKTVGQTYAYPVGENLVPLGDPPSQTEWKHVMDAVGLAIWAQDQSRKQATASAAVKKVSKKTKKGAKDEKKQESE